MTRQITAKAKPATARTKPLTDREITVKFRLRRILVPALIVGALVIVGLVSLVNREGRGGPAANRRGDIASGAAHESVSGAEVLKGLPSAPPPPGKKDGEAPSLGRGEGSGIMGYLAPFLKDPTKFMNEKDAQEVEKVLAALKKKYPDEASAMSRWLDSIQVRINEGKKQKEAGNLEASKRSYDRGESEMRKLLSQVSERERAEAAFKELQETKRKLGGPSATGRPNLLSWIALEKEKDASDAFAKNDFSGARILCGILNRVHLLSSRATDEEQGLAALRELTGTIRKDAEAAQAPSKQAWLYERATTEEEGARQMVKDGLVPQAAEQYILCAFLYEKAKEVSLESAQAGRD